MQTRRKCRFCNNTFLPSHGNQFYCCPEHKNYRKAAKQYEVYAILKDFRRQFLLNYNIFKSFLPEKGMIKLPLYDLKLKGFRSECYYTAFKNEKKQVFYRIAHFRFHLFPKDNIPFIEIISI